MQIKYNSDIISSLFFLIIASLIWFFIPSQIDTMETTAVTAQTIPRIVTVGLFIFSTALLLQGLFKTPKKVLHIDSQTFKGMAFHREMRSLLFCALFILYAILLTFAGYLISTALLSVAILLYYGARKWHYYGISLVTVAAVYSIFTMLLDVNLP